MISLWRLCRDGMGGYARMPDEGGVNQQSSWLMDAFDVIAAAFQELKGDD